MLWSDIFNCNWIDTRWQRYSTYVHTETQYTEQHNETEYQQRNIYYNKYTQTQQKEYIT